jgi:hypothetical protein
VGEVRFESKGWWPLGAARTALAAQAARKRTADRSMLQTRNAGCQRGENKRQEGYSSCLGVPHLSTLAAADMYMRASSSRGKRGHRRWREGNLPRMAIAS